MVTSPSYIIEPQRKTDIGGEYEVVVLGGGPAGIAAAAAAGMHGRRVLLVERYGFLGGMGTAAGVTNFCGLHALPEKISGFCEGHAALPLRIRQKRKKHPL